MSVLRYEFSASEHAESEQKIKRRLRDKKLGPFDAERVSQLRALKDDMMSELRKTDKSRFYKSAERGCSDLGDWRFDTLLRHFQRRHPKVPADAIGGFLPFAIYIYYLR